MRHPIREGRRRGSGAHAVHPTVQPLADSLEKRGFREFRVSDASATGHLHCQRRATPPNGAGNVVDRGRLPALGDSDDRLPRHAERRGRTRLELRPTAARPPRSKSAVRRVAAGRARRAGSDRPPTTKKIARPFSGWIVGGSAMVTSVPPARTSAVERCRISPPITSNTTSTSPASSTRLPPAGNPHSPATDDWCAKAQEARH